MSTPAVVAALPFVASSHEHVEPAFTLTVTPGAAEQVLNPQDVPASGYLRHILLEVVAAGGTGGTLAADGPWNLLSNISLQDVNGTNIVGPVDGYGLYLANVIGGYAFRSNPAESPWFVGTAPNPAFFLRVPVEISQKDGLGALANQNSAANFKLNISVNTLAAAFSVAPSPVPTLTIRGWLEAWTLPARMDNRGRPQSQVPPLLGTGQFWSSQRSSLLVGQNTIPIRRVGNLIRNLVFVARDATGARVDTVFPDPFDFTWDGISIMKASQRYLIQSFFEKIIGFPRPAGVYVLPYSHGGVGQGKLGDEDPTLWLPTQQSSRLEITGVSAVAGSVQVLTNEISPIEASQVERYQVPNDSAFQPRT